ncbi:MAG TPA: hypothetical protein VKA25_00350, partial [Gemmatimonadales bacterium]|nr:hypothetical protein [Gemmatimonadales bacterium]
RRAVHRRTSIRRARYTIRRAHRRAGPDSFRASRGAPKGARADPSAPSGWQKDYVRGIMTQEGIRAKEHQTKLRLKGFAEEE